jgi:TldD protein
VEDYTIIIATSRGDIFADKRPLVRLNISCLAEDGSKRENGSSGGGGRFDFQQLEDEAYWQEHVLIAAKQAIELLNADPAPAGEMDVVLGAGWPGVLIHEAVGHGLEGDCNRKGVSVFAGLMGQQVAAKGVTVVDDGTIEDRRGSLTVDDEGTPSARNVLIENGKLFADLGVPALNPAEDRVMICGSPEMLRDLKNMMEARGFEEGNTSTPGDFVIERAFAEQ